MKNTGNQVVWDLSKGSFYETWYFTFAIPGGQAFWIRGTLHHNTELDKDRIGGLWFARFDAGNPQRNLSLRAFYPESHLDFIKGRSEFEIGSASFHEGCFKGGFEADGHRVSWHLDYAANTEPLWLVPAPLKLARIPKADVCVPNVDIRLFGFVEVDGERIDIDDIPAGQAHHWGYHFAHSWLWGHCNEFDNARDCWVEALSVEMAGKGRARVPAVMLAAKFPSGIFKPHTLGLVLSHSSYSKGVWTFAGQDATRRVEARFSAPEEYFVCQPYVSPHGKEYFCHNSCLCDVMLRVYERKIFRWILLHELRSSKKAAAEFCTPEYTSPGRYEFKSLF